MAARDGPSRWPSRTKGIGWPSASVVFEADDLRIKAGGQTFRGVISAEFIQSWARLDDRSFDVIWQEHGREMRMDISFESDGSDYWIRSWQVYDGSNNPAWVTFRGPLFVTPLDEPMEADVRLAKGRGQERLELRVDGMRIHAFHPGSGPAPLTDCTPPVPLDADAIAAQQVAAFRAGSSDEEWEAYRTAVDPYIEGTERTRKQTLRRAMRRQLEMDPVVEPPRLHDGVSFALGTLDLKGWDEPDHQFKDTGIWTMSLVEAEGFLRAAGVCFEFSYSFVDQRQGRAASITEERWCTAPPRGELVSLEYRDDVLDVEVWDKAVQAKRQLPPAGWNCPTNQRFDAVERTP